ncbi:MAG: sulfite exporter TauE/SafE family protein [Proteobacteria bacterium]|nr:sulfite exporter TauE/SafE family protein [Pseudomonadota bacterium]
MAAPDAAGTAPKPPTEAAAVQAKSDAPDAKAKTNRLESAIQEAIEAGKVKPEAEPGLLGIPGAPKVNPILALLWAVWVGWVFSTVGAFGGVLAAVGHVTVFGLGNYAASFGKTLKLNKLVTDSLRVSNQWLVGTSALVSSIKWATMGRIVLPMGVALGVGSLAGSILIPWLTAGKVDLKAYQGYFGVFVLVLGCYLYYETTPGARAKKKLAAAAAKAFEESSKGHDASAGRVKLVSISLSRVVFTFCGVEFSFNTALPVIGGFLIAAVASFLGVGGGFLLVPFLTSISQLPMYLAAGTSAFAVLVGMVTSITTFMFGGTPVYWPLVGLELVGIVVGSWIGPMTAKYLSDAWLKRFFILLAFVVGIDYFMNGFFHIDIWKIIGGLFGR